MAEAGSTTDPDRAEPKPNEVQAHINTFWNTVAADYEAHAGNVAEYGSAEYRLWLMPLLRSCPILQETSSMWRVAPATWPWPLHPSATV